MNDSATQYPIGEGAIKIEEHENVIMKLIDHFHALGCREFAEEKGILYLRWPAGTKQKVTVDLDSASTVQ
jgi:hypothetical protein